MKKGSVKSGFAQNAIKFDSNTTREHVSEIHSTPRNKNDELTNKFEICVSTMKTIENLNSKQYQYLQQVQGDTKLMQSYSQQASLFKKMFENLTNFLIFSAANISNDVTNINANITELKETSEQNMLITDNLNDTILDLKEIITENKETIENLMQMNKTLQKQIKSQTNLINSLQSENSSLISQIKSFQISNENLISQIQVFNKTIQESNETQANYKESIISHLQEIFVDKYSSKYVKRTITKNILNDIIIDIKNILGY